MSSAQPHVNEAYNTAGNPVSKEPQELREAAQQDNSRTTERRNPGDEEDQQPKPAPLGRGIHGAPAGEEAKGETEESIGRHNELDAEQMAAPGEKKVYDAVTSNSKPGSGGNAPDTASDLDRLAGIFIFKSSRMLTSIAGRKLSSKRPAMRSRPQRLEEQTYRARLRTSEASWERCESRFEALIEVAF